MNIAIILPYLKAGGTERQASYIANHLHAKGYNVSLICIERKDTFLDLFDVEVRYLNSKNSNFKILKNINRLSRLLIQLKADIVLSRAWSVNLLTSKAAVKAGIPSVLFLSGSTDLSDHSMIKRKIQKNVLNSAANIISVSHKAKENCKKWLKIDERKITVIHNGIDTEKVRDKAKNEGIIPEFLKKLKYPKIVFVGRLIHRKGLDLLVKALSAIREEGINASLIVVGDGIEKATYKKLSEELGVAEYVYFIGEQKNPFPFMNVADTFVLPSRSEGFPNVLIEAMALGLPVIASDCETGPGEILDGRNGLLASPDCSDSLSNNLSKLLNSNILQDELAKKAYSTVRESFDLENQLNKIEQVILQSVPK